MSINTALLAGISGLRANSTALSSISTNIANVNTIGYKRAYTDFHDVITAQQLFGEHPEAAASTATTRNLLSEQGDIQQSTSKTDLAISGPGFFVTTEKPTDLTSTDVRSFTRAGSFTPDNAGLSEELRGALPSRLGRRRQRRDRHRPLGPHQAFDDQRVELRRIGPAHHTGIGERQP